MKRVLFRMISLAAAALMSTALVFAQQQPMGGQQQTPSTQQNPNTGMNTMQQMQQQQQQQQQQPMQAMMDRDFVHAALQGGMTEVKLGQLAAQKGASADVRQFGQKMVNDHTQLNNLMQQVAAKMDMRDPKGPSKKGKKLYAKLSALSGAQFDNAYIKAMLKAHKDDLEAFRHEATSSQNPMVRQAAEEGAQLISTHLRLIQQIARQDGVKG